MGMKQFLRMFALVMVVIFIASLTTPAYTSNEGKMRVWVEFSPGHAGNVEKALNGVGAEFHYRFDKLNSFVVTVPENALNGLRRNPNVISIEEDVIRYAAADEVPFGIDMVQARDIWDANYDLVIDSGAPTGSNRTVCIIDSGLYTEHEDFQNSANILGGYPEGWDNDQCGHGTHVAGTINAQLNDVGVVGVSPGQTQLYIVKVFGEDCAWTYSSTLVDAADHCVDAGANIISMSLGGGSSNRREQRAFDGYYSQGILSIAAAGNDGNTEISYPGGYDSVMAVAAIDEEMNIADFSQQNDTVEIAAPGVGVLSTLPYIETNTVTVDGLDYNAHHVEYAAYGTITAPLGDGGLCNTETDDLTGQIALCERGDISFYDKVVNAVGRGAVAVIIYNNNPEDEFFTLGEEITGGPIAVSLSQADGQYLAANKLGQNATIDSNIQWEVSGYEAWNGTSMATPHVSGVAALVWSANPSWTNAEIRDALTSTALDLGDPGRDVAYGYGLVQAKDALDYLEGTEPPGNVQMYVEVTTNKSTYADRETVQITVDTWDEYNEVVANALIEVTITTPNGSTTSLTGYTDANGTANFTYRLRTRRTGSGTYEIDVLASKDGYSNANASTTFVAQ